MLNKYFIIFLSIYLICSNNAFCSYNNFKVEQIHNIVIKGNKRIPKESIISYFYPLQKASYTPMDIDRIIKKLYETSFFSKIEINYHNDKLNIVVIEAPIINRIIFENNKKIKDSDLIKVIIAKPNRIYTEQLLKNDVDYIIKSYQNKGLFNVLVSLQLVYLKDNKVDIIFKISENHKATIKKINFLGNKNFSQNQLKEVLFSKEQNWYKLISPAILYEQEKIELDAHLLQEHYLDNGFAQFQILNIIPEMIIDKRGFMITFIIDEGLRYKFGKYKIINNIKNLNVAFDNFIKVTENNLFKIKDINNSINLLTKFLQEKGYALVNIAYKIDYDKVNHIANVEFVIEEGDKYYINNINIKNNTRTLDKVIRRQMEIAEGDSYNLEKINKSVQKINNLNYFNHVNLSTAKFDDNKVDLEIDVGEKSTGSLNFNVGYNSASGPLLGFKISENNLLGTGKVLDFDLQYAKLEKNAGLYLTFPYFLDFNYTLGFSLFYNNKSFQQKNRPKLFNNEEFKNEIDFSSKSYEKEFNTISKGSSISAIYDLAENLHYKIEYSLRSEHIGNFSKISSIFFQPQANKYLTSAVSHSALYDKTDNRIKPNKGYFINVNQELAGFLGDVKYLKNEVIAAYYRPLHGEKLTLKILGKVGNIFGLDGQNIRITDNFFIGEETIRGFDKNGIGAREAKTMQSLGGKYYYASTAEVNFPLGLPKDLSVKGAAFFDAASLFKIDVPVHIPLDQRNYYDDNFIRISYGAGAIWDSPLGTIRVDYGIPLRKKPYDQLNRFRISFGTTF